MVPWYITSIITAVNIILIGSLLYVYIRNTIKIKSGFTYGLLIFALLFLIQNGFVFYFAITMMPLYAEGVGNYMIVFSFLQTIAFVVLNWVTWK